MEPTLMSVDRQRARRLLRGSELPLALLVAAVVFAVDTQIELGVAVGAMHVIPVLVIARAERRRLSLVVASACTLLIGVKLAFWPLGAAIPWMVIANRGISIFVVWATALLGLHLVEVRQRLRKAESLLTVCAWTKQVKVDGQWIPFDQYLARNLGFQVSHGMTEEVARKFTADLDLEVRNADPPRR